jgi:hypothetical protein
MTDSCSVVTETPVPEVEATVCDPPIVKSDASFVTFLKQGRGFVNVNSSSDTTIEKGELGFGCGYSDEKGEVSVGGEKVPWREAYLGLGITDYPRADYYDENDKKTGTKVDVYGNVFENALIRVINDMPPDFTSTRQFAVNLQKEQMRQFYSQFHYLKDVVGSGTNDMFFQGRQTLKVFPDSKLH